MEADDLPARQRAAKYRDLAQSQRELAEACELPEIRATHLELAAMWGRLAEEAERHLEPAEPAALGEGTAPTA
ncbi:hypothetical protein [Phenylobacterium sp.]|uniref:hypothetical protein n=1 Tax=Phenylobacterium sp. TaxID=1871053 RepID=UPI002FE41CF5